ANLAAHIPADSTPFLVIAPFLGGSNGNLEIVSLQIWKIPQTHPAISAERAQLTADTCGRGRLAPHHVGDCLASVLPAAVKPCRGGGSRVLILELEVCGEQPS
ncbi:hypothetical protein H1C71_026993, partial [Ictidomys tridecemlineatus]